MTSYLKITEPGKYKIRGYILFEGKETEIKTISFEVNGLLENILPIFAVGMGFTGTLAVIAYLINKNNVLNSKNKKNPPFTRNSTKTKKKIKKKHKNINPSKKYRKS